MQVERRLRASEVVRVHGDPAVGQNQLQAENGGTVVLGQSGRGEGFLLDRERLIAGQ